MILITGSAGYIGSHLSYFFEKKKIPFVGVDNLSSSYKLNINNKTKHFFLNISNEKKILELIKKYDIKTIIHTAASSYVLEAEKNKKKYFLNNIVKTKKFIDTCKKANIENFIFLSSSNVYQENKKNIFSEKSLLKPKNYYGKNKLAIENFLLRRKIKNLVILRLFNVVGLFKKFKTFRFKKENYQRFIFKIFDLVKVKKEIQLNYIMDKKTKNFPGRDFIDINDLIDLITTICKKISTNNNISGIYNVGSGTITPINSIIKLIEKKFNKKIKLKLQKIDKNEINYTCAKIKKIKNKFQWYPKVSLEKSITSTFKYLITKK